jgi:hypothetical protein
MFKVAFRKFAMPVISNQVFPSITEARQFARKELFTKNYQAAIILDGAEGMVCTIENPNFQRGMQLL